MFENHIDRMKGMTCCEKTRYVLEVILRQERPLSKSRFWNKVYQYFYREMHYQRRLENCRRYNYNRAIRKGFKAPVPNPRRRIPNGFESQSEFRQYVARGMRHLCLEQRIISRKEAFEAGLRLSIGAENR